MKKIGICLAVAFVFLPACSAWALNTAAVANSDWALLKQDLKDGKIKVGITRLKDFAADYGDAPAMTSTDKKVTYDYGDLKVEFDKVRYMRDWSYDSFKKPAYTDDIKKLRHDLEAKQIVGDNITYAKIIRDYEAPTESYITEDDGGYSIFYWGDIKMTFENVMIANSWKGSNLIEPKEVIPESPEPVKDNKLKPEENPKPENKIKPEDKPKPENKEVAPSKK